MPVAILNNEFVHIALALGSVVTGTYSFAAAVGKQFTTYHVYVRRFLNGLTYGVAMGFMGYLFDKQLNFFYERLLSPFSPIALPNFTYGIAFGVIFFFSVLASPVLRDEERGMINPGMLVALSAIFGGIASAFFFPVGAIFLVNHFHWFGSSLNTVVLLVIVAVGFAFGLASALIVSVPAAQGNLGDAGAKGCVIYFIGLLLGVPTIIAYGQIMGWGTLLLFTGLSFGVGIAVAIISAIINNLPPWVLAVLGIGLVVLFGVAKGYQTLSGAFS